MDKKSFMVWQCHTCRSKHNSETILGNDHQFNLPTESGRPSPSSYARLFDLDSPVSINMQIQKRAAITAFFNCAVHVHRSITVTLFSSVLTDWKRSAIPQLIFMPLWSRLPCQHKHVNSKSWCYLCIFGLESSRFNAVLSWIKSAHLRICNEEALRSYRSRKRIVLKPSLCMLYILLINKCVYK
jgi:hypothetical protein